MPLSVQALPNWLLGLILVLLSLLAAQTLYALFPQHWRDKTTEADRHVVLAALGVIATLNSLLLAWSAVIAWQSFGAADQAVQGEATAISELGRTLVLYDTEAARFARERLRAYGHSVVTREWPAMLEDKPSATTRDAVHSLLLALGDLRPANASEVALLGQVWTQANELLAQRRVRLQASRAKIPAALWAVVVAASVMTLLPLAASPQRAGNRWPLFTVAAALALVCHCVATMDRPFLGSAAVTSAPIEDSLTAVQRMAARPR